MYTLVRFKDRADCTFVSRDVQRHRIHNIVALRALARSVLSLTRADHRKSAYIVAVQYIEDRHMLNIDRDIRI